MFPISHIWIFFIFFSIKNLLLAQPDFNLAKTAKGDIILPFLRHCIPCDFDSLQTHITNGGYLDSAVLQQFVIEQNNCVLKKDKVKFLYRKNGKWDFYDFNFKKLNPLAYDSIQSAPNYHTYKEAKRIHWGQNKYIQSSCYCRQSVEDVFLHKNKKIDLYLSELDTLLVLDADSIKFISVAKTIYGYFKNGKMGFVNTQTAYSSPAEYDSFKLLTGENPLILYKNVNAIHFILERGDTSKIYLQDYSKVLDFMPALFRYERFLSKKTNMRTSCVLTPGNNYGFFCAFKEQNKESPSFDIFYNATKRKFGYWSISVDDFFSIWSKNYALFSAIAITKIIDINLLMSYNLNE